MSDSESEPELVRVIGRCDTCGYTLTASERDGFEEIVDDLSKHIDDPTSCYGFSVFEEYSDGTEKRVL